MTAQVLGDEGEEVHSGGATRVSAGAARCRSSSFLAPGTWL